MVLGRVVRWGVSTWSNSSSDGLALSLRLSSMAFLKAGVWATMVTVLADLVWIEVGMRRGVRFERRGLL